MNKRSLKWISLALLFAAQLSCSKKNTSTKPDTLRTIWFVQSCSGGEMFKVINFSFK